jgi:hypothetical protein
MCEMAYFDPSSVRRTHPALMTATLALPAACQPRPETIHDAAPPPTAAIQRFAIFDEALRCIDDSFLVRGNRDIYVATNFVARNHYARGADASIPCLAGRSLSMSRDKSEEFHQAVRHLIETLAVSQVDKVVTQFTGVPGPHVGEERLAVEVIP